MKYEDVIDNYAVRYIYIDNPDVNVESIAHVVGVSVTRAEAMCDGLVRNGDISQLSALFLHEYGKQPTIFANLIIRHVEGFLAILHFKAPEVVPFRHVEVAFSREL